jgi:glutathione S-transferase
MSEGTLYIGNRRYSSWSMRGWLLVRLVGLDVDEVVMPFAGTGGVRTPEIVRTSPSGLVPYLEHRGVRVWESLAIAEYCAEIAPGLWPAEQVARAYARSAAAEMHAGFVALRRAMPMNLGRDFSGRGRTPEALADITRIETIWSEARSRWAGEGPYLQGASFGIADAMFAPVATRFLTYRPVISPTSRSYCEAVRSHPLVAAWYDAAVAEPASWLLESYENPD